MRVSEVRHAKYMVRSCVYLKCWNLFISNFFCISFIYFFLILHKNSIYWDFPSCPVLRTVLPLQGT